MISSIQYMLILAAALVAFSIIAVEVASRPVPMVAVEPVYGHVGYAGDYLHIKLGLYSDAGVCVDKIELTDLDTHRTIEITGSTEVADIDLPYCFTGYGVLEGAYYDTTGFPVNTTVAVKIYYTGPGKAGDDTLLVFARVENDA